MPSRRRRSGNRLYLDPRPLIPILVAWGAAMAVIGLEDDIGFAALLFVLFIGLLWWRRSLGYLVLGWCSSAWVRISRHDTSARCTSGGAVAEPVADGAEPGNTQLSEAWFSLGRRRRGNGLGLAPHFVGAVPELTSDMIFAAMGTEMGLIGVRPSSSPSSCWSAPVPVAQTARSDFSRLMATG